MANSRPAYQLAAEMLRLTLVTLPPTLARRLEDVEVYLARVGGSLGSRQAVAIIVADWYREIGREEIRGQ